MTTDRVLPDGRQAPQLLVHYHCPTCHRTWTLDVYRGVPTCPHDRTILEADQLA